MFEVEPNLWLQAFHADWFAGWMRAMSWLGKDWFYMPAMLLLLFGVRLRPAMGVLLALVLTGATTDGLKQGFGLPRPSEVDARVLDDGESGHFLVADGGAGGFWELPAPQAIAAARARPEPDYGFVSGHTSAATVLVLAIALFFGVRNPWGWAFVVSWPLLMGISRMYLGRHFLGDVIGGLAVGVIGAIAACAFLRRVREAGPGKRTWSLLAAAMGAAAAASLLPWVDPGSAGAVAGTLLCIGMLQWTGYPDDDAGLPRRFTRVALAFVIGYGTSHLLDAAYAAGGWPERHAMAFVFAIVGYAAAILGTVAVARACRLYPAPIAVRASA